MLTIYIFIKVFSLKILQKNTENFETNALKILNFRDISKIESKLQNKMDFFNISSKNIPIK